ncbi:hypothetical protein AADZ91_00130 [Colwelliaceae bacterium 6441]
MKNEKKELNELNELVQTLEVEELEERLEFLTCHWGSDRPNEGGGLSCHHDF